MADLSQFTTRIAPHVPQAPDPLIEQAVLDTCIDFCERSLVVRATMDQIVTRQGVFEYDLDSPQQDTQVCRIMRAWNGALELRPWTEDQVSDPFAWTSTVTGQTQTQGTPRFFDEPEPGTLGLYPTPDATIYYINMRVALQPTRSATTVPDVLFDNWVDGIVDGALARLFAVPAAFGNPGYSSAHQGKYTAQVNQAMLEAMRGRTRAEARVRPVRI